MRKKINILFILLLIVGNVWAQPCLTDWLYRKEITINSTNAGTLINHQIKVTINTQDLVTFGKARVDGGDIRFTDAAGALLPYWFDPTTYNTTSTDFWIKANTVIPGNSMFYMFYGNSTASTYSNGDVTFELFDNFDSGDFSAIKWEKCGDNSNFTVSGGNASFTSSLTNTDGVIKSNNTFSSVIAESKVNSATNGRAIIGLIDANDDGYVTTFETNPSDIMKMMKVSAGGSCQTVDQLLAPISTAAGAIDGIWSLEWSQAAVQKIGWKTSTTDYTDASKSAAFGNPKRLIIGSTLSLTTATGSLNVDWVRLRKYVDADPTFTLGAEDESPVDPDPTNSGPYCGGETIQLSSNAYAGAVYSWTGPNAFTSSAQNPTIPSSVAATHAGTYLLSISMPNGCNTVNLSTTVDISSASVGGTISGAASLCSGSNSGSLTLAGETGDILRWEMSNSSGGPWLNLVNTTNTLAYQNLEDTTYYRSVVKSGECPEDISAITQIDVDEPTEGGFLIGTSSVCDGSNAGDISLVYENGAVLKWEYSEDNGTSWTDITNNTGTLNYTNLTTTTGYRAQVKNGNCPALYSSEVDIAVNPNPVPSYTASQVCKGLNTDFTNTSTGNIVSYSWNFGNGSGSISQNPSFQYQSDGTYSVELSVESDKGCTGTFVDVVTVNPLPVVDINQVDVCLGTPMNFQGLVSVAGGSVSNYDWNFGDGNTDNIQSPQHTYTAAGTFDVTLVATSNNSCIDSASTSVEITAAATIDFVADSVCLGESIDFINTSSSSSSSVTYTWNYGNGATSTLYSPTYTYPATGDYTVSLQAQVTGGTSGCLSSITKTVQIYEVPASEFTFMDVCQADSASFTDLTTYTPGTNLLTYAWDFGDASSSTLDSPKHLYGTPSNYSVALTTTSPEGCTNTNNHQITIHYMPNANYSFSDVCLNENMIFTSSSNITIGNLGYEWDFEDGSTSTTENPVHLYTNDTSYTVQLIATSDEGCKDTISKVVTVNPLPSVKFGVDAVCDGATSVFSDSTQITTGSISSYTWDFSDGSSSTSQNPTHLFLNVGTYNVSLIAESDKGCVDDTTQFVIVNPVPIADFSINDACLNASVVFYNESSIQAGTMSYAWDFSDGATSILADTDHEFALAGLYPVQLNVTSGEGCIDSIIKYAEVFALPIVNAGIDTSVSQGFSVQLDGYYPNAQAYSWSPSETLDDNTIYDPSATPLETTTYELLVTDANGCKNKDEVDVEVIKDYKLFIHNIITPDGNGINDTWMITNIETFESANVYIYNRWEEEVLRVIGYQNDWEGVNGADQLPDGTYYYIIEFSHSDKVYKGALTVLRNK